MLCVVRTWGHGTTSPGCGLPHSGGFDTAIGPAIVRWDTQCRKITEFQVRQSASQEERRRKWKKKMEEEWRNGSSASFNRALFPGTL
jgi:hypothetical protein